MKSLIACTVLVCLFSLPGRSQSTEVQKLNLDFEQNTDGYPDEWTGLGSKLCRIYIDSASRQNGKYSVVIENKAADPNIKALKIALPENYKGKFISLSGYIKTENVTDGYAGLWLSIEPGIAVNDMRDSGVTGTNDWKKYEITLPLNPRKTDKITFGGLMLGKGKMWLDNLRVTIDGKDLDNKDLAIYTKELLPAEKDKEFEKGSGIVLPALNSQAIVNLELLGRVWGFLKYHHPEIAKGNYNWDYELFRMLPGYLTVKSQGERDSYLVSWIKKYGQLPDCATCKSTSTDAALKPDLTWIDKDSLSNDLSVLLKDIYNKRNQGENFYIGMMLNSGPPYFPNEESYYNMPYPDDGFRLLALYKYWNIISYFFPNRELTNKKWSTVLKEYIPEFLHAKDELQYELAAVKIIGEINDSHASLAAGGVKIDELRGDNYAAFKAAFMGDEFVVIDYYNPEFSADCRLRVGDVITRINGKTVRSIVDSLKIYYPASNEACMLRNISVDLLRSSKTTINLEYISGKKIKQQIVPLYDQHRLNFRNRNVKDEQCFKILKGNIGYITLANIREEDIPQIKDSFKNTRGIIIDIRNYPSAYVPYALGSYFVTEPTAFAKLTYANPDNPGEFTFTNGPKIQSDGNHYPGKLVVLVNEQSQSQSEFTALAFRAIKNAKIIGSTTAGADGELSYIYLPGGLQTQISGVGVYYPDGKQTQRVGIVPDIIVKPTKEGIKKGKDEVLEKAIEIISGR